MRAPATEVDSRERPGHRWGALGNSSAVWHRAIVRLNETMAEPEPVEDGGSTRLGIAPPPSLGGARPPSLKLGPGVRVPKTPYRIRSWLGDGSMGVVYRAEHVDLERQVALKILRPEVSDSFEIADMLRNEAKNASRIDSEYIAEVYDLGELEDGRVWFSMPLLDGLSLDKVLADGALEHGRTIGILRQICKGLAAAHGVGIIHRDVKPENIMLVSDRGRRDAVRMLDWGIAVLRAEAARAARRTAGTPYYIAPEVVSRIPFDHRVDVYSLGCTAFEMIAGQPPFAGPDLASVLVAHVDEPAPRLETLVPDVPPGLADVVAKCLAKSPENRYADATELEAALCEAQIAARLDSTWDDLPLPDVDPERRAALAAGMPDVVGRAPQRRRWFLPAVVGAAIALAAVGGAYSMFADGTETRSTEVDDLVKTARAAASRSFFVYPPASSPETQTAYGAVVALEQLDGGAEPAAEAGVLRQEFAETLVRLGDRYWERPGGRPFAIDYYAEALMFEPGHERAKERASLTPGELAHLRDKASDGGFSDSELQAVEPLVALAEEDPETRAQALLELASAAGVGASTATRLDALVEADPEVPEQVKKTVRARRRAAPEPVEPVEAASTAEVTDPDGVDGETGGETEGDTDGAVDEAALAAAEPKTVRDRAAAREHTRLGAAAVKRGALRDAKREFQKAIAADDRYAPAYHGLSRLAFHAGDYAEASRHGERTIRLASKNAKYRIDLGDAYYKSYRYADARKQYEVAKTLGNVAADGRLAKVAGK